jgi:hypothetical protein
MTEDEWKYLARDRAPTIKQGDLFAPPPLAAQIATSIESAMSMPSVPLAPEVAPSTEAQGSQAMDDPPPVEAPSLHANADDAAPVARSQETEQPQPSWIGRSTNGWLSR